VRPRSPIGQGECEARPNATRSAGKRARSLTMSSTRTNTATHAGRPASRVMRTPAAAASSQPGTCQRRYRANVHASRSGLPCELTVPCEVRRSLLSDDQSFRRRLPEESDEIAALLAGERSLSPVPTACAAGHLLEVVDLLGDAPHAATVSRWPRSAPEKPCDGAEHSATNEHHDGEPTQGLYNFTTHHSCSLILVYP